MKLLRTVTFLSACALLLAVPDRRVSASSDDLLAKSQAAYAALKSYSDTGSVDEEFGPTGAVVQEHHTFKTFFRAPRHFLFDFVKEENADRFVVWADDEAFHTWWKATGVADIYPKGQAVGAFVAGGEPTYQALMQLSPWLFSQADLDGPLTEFGDAKLAGTEAIDGHPCNKLVGVAKSTYRASGRVVNVRPMTVWIDAQTLLVRRVREDAAAGAPAGDVSLKVTTFAPQVNPTLDDAVFLFTPPKDRFREVPIRRY
jgi:outer membrane lipoprotein-sorting protein